MINKTLEMLSDINKILFICKGNICRSPFAQYYAQKKLPDSLTILSAGYYEKTGRKCPRKAIKAAKEYDVQLENHRSILIAKDLAQDAQIIYVFDEENRQTLYSLFPFAKNKIYLLGEMNENSPTIIPDPYGKKYSQYKRAYELISQSINNINYLFK